MDHVYGCVPPVAARVSLYRPPMTPLGIGEGVVITNPPAVTVIDRLCVSVAGVGLALSVTRTVKVEVPAPNGVPLIAPVEGSSASPEGNDPPAIDHA